MAEYIEREAAIAAIMNEPPDAHYPQWYAEKIKSIPAADVVSVVRCKDCKHLLRDLSDRKYHICMRLRMPQRVDLDDFCSYGERKEG